MLKEKVMLLTIIDQNRLLTLKATVQLLLMPLRSCTEGPYFI